MFFFTVCYSLVVSSIPYCYFYEFACYCIFTYFKFDLTMKKFAVSEKIVFFCNYYLDIILYKINKNMGFHFHILMPNISILEILSIIPLPRLFSQKKYAENFAYLLSFFNDNKLLQLQLFCFIRHFLTKDGSLFFSIDNNLVSPWCVERPQYKYPNKFTTKTSPNGYFSLFKLK